MFDVLSQIEGTSREPLKLPAYSYLYIPIFNLCEHEEDFCFDILLVFLLQPGGTRTPKQKGVPSWRRPCHGGKSWDVGFQHHQPVQLLL